MSDFLWTMMVGQLSGELDINKIPSSFIVEHMIEPTGKVVGTRQYSMKVENRSTQS